LPDDLQQQQQQQQKHVQKLQSTKSVLLKQ
jgi:hypothetical protein